MSITFWIISVVLFTISSLILIYTLISRLKYSESLQILLTGIRNGFNKSGLYLSQQQLPVELYEWEVCDECINCEDCLERESWKAMDIADWMKAGLPNTPEANTTCENQCRCKLVLTEKLFTIKD